MAGWISNKGYRLIAVQIDGKRKLVLEHRWLMQRYLGRPLARTEVVHHKNGNRLDNRLANLAVMEKRNHDDQHGNLTLGRQHAHERPPWNKGTKRYATVRCYLCGKSVVRDAKYVTRNQKRNSRSVCGTICRSKVANTR